MTIFESLKLQGFSVSQNLPTKGLISLMSNIPSYKSLFPDVFSMIDTLQSYLDRYDSAVESLAKARSYVTDCENKLVQAKDLYDKILNTPAAYMGSGAVPAPVTPLPTLQVTFTGITTAQEILKKAEQALDKAEEKVQSLNTTIENYKDKIVQKLMTTKV